MNSLGQACHNDPFWGQATFPLFITFAVNHPILYCHNTCFSPPSGVLESACTDLSNCAHLFPTLQSVTSAVRSLKLGVLGIFTPRKGANATNQGF